MSSTGADRVFGTIRKGCKPVVVGIDFGTAFSGFAYAYTADPGTVRYGAPTATSVQQKVPTVLLRLDDGSWRFGNDALHMYDNLLMDSESGTTTAQLFKGFKMALKDKSSGFETLQATSTTGQKHSLMDLVQQSLRLIKEFAVAKVCDEFGSALNVKSSADVQWVLTVPAIWTEFGKAFMRRAAFQAGLMESEESRHLMLVLEPEAAALAVQEGMMSMEIFKRGSQFMVLDCGGGTIDITSHQVERTQPVLSMKTIAVPSGGAWGGETVNANFQAFLRKLLTEESFACEAELVAEIHKIYSDFDVIKTNYDPAAAAGASDSAAGGDASLESVGHIKVSDMLDRASMLAGLVEAYNAAMDAASPPTPHLKVNPPPAMLRKGYITLSHALMMSFFEPSLAKIVDSTRSVLSQHPGIEFVIVVGGYGGSKVVRERVYKEFNGRAGVTCILPDSRPKPQGAIAHGAVYDGMYDSIVSSRVAAHTYGVGREGGEVEVLVHKGAELPVDHTVTVRGMPPSLDVTTCSWPLYRSDALFPGRQQDETLLGEVQVPCPVIGAGDVPVDRQQQAVFRFGHGEIQVEVVNAAKETKSSVIKYDC